MFAHGAWHHGMAGAHGLSLANNIGH
jgi:hypothetical protein